MATVAEPSAQNAVSPSMPAMDILANPRPRPQLYGTKVEDVSIFASTGIGGGTTGMAAVPFRRALAVSGVAEDDKIGTNVFIAHLDRTLVPDLDHLFDQFVYYRYSSLTVDLQSVATITASGAIQVGYNPDPGNPTAIGTTDDQKLANVDKLVALAASKTVSARGNTQIQPFAGNTVESDNYQFNMSNVIGNDWKYCKPDGYSRAERFGEIFALVRAPAVQGSNARFVMTVVGTVEFMGTTRNTPMKAVNTYADTNFIDFTKVVSSDLEGDSMLYFPLKVTSKLVFVDGDYINFCRSVNVNLEAVDDYGITRFFSTNQNGMLVKKLSQPGLPVKYGLMIKGMTLGIDFQLSLEHTKVRVTPSPRYVTLRQVIPAKFANLVPLDFINEIRGN